MTKSDVREENFITAAHEDYLRAIYLLLQRGEKASNSAISTYLDVAPASATNMVKRLAALGLVAYAPYQGVELTPNGRAKALVVVRYHRLLELYLARVLHMPWDHVHAEADKLEHVISGALADAFAAALGEPTADPHGDPIPTRNGSLPPTSSQRLSDQPVGQWVTLVRVGAQDAEALRQLGDLGLYPGTGLVMQGRAADGGYLVTLNDTAHTVPRELADQLYVEPMSRDAQLSKV
jgi:DtxR family transcriptional regulator, Mn-dependent transcriptional regulator